MNKIYKTWPGGRFKVLTLSYDDGKVQDRRLVKILNDHGIRATFNLNSGLTNDTSIRIPKEEWKELYQGHEVAVHTVSHPTLYRSPDLEIVKEILNDREEIERVMHRPIRGMAYPNGACDDRIIGIAKTLGIRYARQVNDTYAQVCSARQFAKEAEGNMRLGDKTGFELPEDYYRWTPTCHHNHHLMQYAKEFAALYKKQYLYMFYVWGHSFEFDDDDNWNIIEDFAEFIGGRDDIWYATNIEIVDYNEAFANLQFSADNSFVYNPTATDVWLSVNDGPAICVPAGNQMDL